MMGLSRTVRDDQTTATEFLIIREVEGNLVYTAFPSGQLTYDYRVSTDDDVVDVYLRAAESISSSSDRGRALTAIMDR